MSRYNANEWSKPHDPYAPPSSQTPASQYPHDQDVATGYAYDPPRQASVPPHMQLSQSQTSYGYPTGDTPSYSQQSLVQTYHNNAGGGYDDRDAYGSQVNMLLPSQPAYPPPMPSPRSPYGQQQQYYPQQYQQQTQYSVAREQMMKSRKKKEIRLTDGNLVLQLEVPRSILQFNSYKGEDLSTESGKLRYTAVTGDPDDFTRSHFRLRQFNSKRRTELAIFLTMYNEDEKLFCRTFTSVIKNIQHLQSRTKSKTWGEGSWKKIVVCVVSDGRAKINPRTLKVLGLYGAYQDGVMKDTVEGKDVTAHLFEYTTQVVVDAEGVVSGGIAPVQVIFCLKEQNKKKLNSHRWCFNAFCPQLLPNVCILLDVGTRPSGNSIYHLWKAFDKNSSIGGACGEITVDTGRGCGNLLNVLVAAQNFEYKMSNILDKPLESVFGYISVLPGAFSAYRYKALLNTAPSGKGPLQAYFLGEKMHEPGAVSASLGESNMYLAEDRVLCFEIVAKKKEAWTLKYVKAAKASTDTPDTVPEFISQRRRWMNGALFSAIHSTTHFYRVWTSGQGFFRKIWLSILFFYNAVQLVFQFVGLSSFYLAFFFICNSSISDPNHDPFNGKGADIISVANSAYIAMLGIIIVVSLGNKPQGSKWAYIGVMTGFAIIFVLALYCIGWTIYLGVPHTVAGWKNFGNLIKTNSAVRDIVISLASTYLLYIAASLLHGEPWHLFTSFIQYMFLLPSYVSVLTIYSIANLQDLAWGTKGSTGTKDLGGAKSKKGTDGKDTVELELPDEPEDVDNLWLHLRKDLGTKEVVVHQKRDVDQKKADQFANQRTNWLLAYLGTNMIIVIFFTSTFWSTFLAARANETGGPVINWYMVAIFWSTAGLSAFRFLGSTLYLLFRLIGW